MVLVPKNPGLQKLLNNKKLLRNKKKQAQKPIRQKLKMGI